MAKKYGVGLSAEKRAELEAVVKKRRVAAHKRRHAEILLKAEEGKKTTVAKKARRWSKGISQ